MRKLLFIAAAFVICNSSAFAFFDWIGFENGIEGIDKDYGVCNGEYGFRLYHTLQALDNAKDEEEKKQFSNLVELEAKILIGRIEMQIRNYKQAIKSSTTFESQIQDYKQQIKILQNQIQYIKNLVEENGLVIEDI